MTKRGKRAKHSLDRDKKHPPFGATKATAKAHAKQREDKNRIFELEQENANLAKMANFNIELARALQHWIDANRVQPARMKALRVFAALPVDTAIDMNVLEHVIVIAKWLIDIDQAAADVASGKQEADRLFGREPTTPEEAGWVRGMKGAAARTVQ